MRLCLLKGSTLRSFPKLLVFSGILAAGFTGAFSQVLIDPATDGGFEVGPAFADNGWTAVGPPTNMNRRWYCGTGQAGFTGARCGFIGNSTTTVGTNNLSRTVHLYKTITIPVGATNIQLAFDYKQAISDFIGPADYYDYIQVTLDVAAPTNGNVPVPLPIFGPFPDVDIVSFTTQNVTISNAYATGTPINLIFTFIADNVSPVGNGAIDNVSLTYDVPPPVDITPTALASPLPGTCYGPVETVSIRVKNFGSAPVDFSTDQMVVNASVTGPNPQTFTPVTINTGVLAVGDSLDVEVSPAYDMSMAGTYTFSANTVTNNDGNTGNDIMTDVSITNSYGVTASVSDSVVCAGDTVSLFAAATPYSSVLLMEDFNGAAAGWTTTNLSVGGDDPSASAWTLRPDEYDPLGFWDGFISSNDDSQFYFTNSDEQGEDGITNTILQTPVMNTVGFDSLVLDFYHFFVYNTDDDSCLVEASTDGITWDTVVTYKNNDIGDYENFLHSTVDLSAYGGNPTLSLRFRFSAPWGYGWAIDNVTINASGAAYTYNWTSTPAGFTSTDQNPTGVTVNAGTIYHVQATASTGCTAKADVTVNTSPVPVLSTTVTDISCNGETDGEIDLTVTGGAPTFTYSWSNSATTEDITGLSAGSYTVTVTDGNTCTSTAVATVDEPAALNISSVVTEETNGNDGAINLTVSGGTPSYTYAWSNSAATEDISGLAGGNYTVTVTDANGCTETATITVGSTLGINNEENVSLSFYPNPSTGIINISVKNIQSDDLLIQVMDMSGKVIFSKVTIPASDNYIEQIDLTQAAAGTYLVRFSTDAGTYNGRIIITR